MENVILAVVAGPLKGCDAFLPSLHLLPTLVVYISNFTHSDFEGCGGGYPMTSTLLEVQALGKHFCVFSLGNG